MFNVGRKYQISHRPTQMEVEQQAPLVSSAPPPPPPKKAVNGKGLDELIEKIKTVNVRQNKKITF
jgi:hypothetical protein